MPFLIVPLVSLAAIPGAAALFNIIVIVVILLVILAIINMPMVAIPAPFKQIATWIVAGTLVVYLLWQALTLTGIL